MKRWIIVLAACSSSSAPQSAPKPQYERLEKGQAVTKQIKTGESHRYTVQLAAQMVARGIVMQKGVDLMLIAYDPRGKKLGEFDSPNGAEGPEPFVIEAKGAGAYTLEVKPFVEPPPGPGQPAPPPGPPAPPVTGNYDAHLDDVITADAYADELDKRRVASPKVLEVMRAIRHHRKDLVEKFWKELAGHSPIVEDYPGDPKSVLVTFVMKSSSPYVGMLGGPGIREKPLVRLGDSDLWYLSARMPSDSRFDYVFFVLDTPPPYHVPRPATPGPDPRFSKRQADPNNKSMHFDLSRVDLPGAPPQPWIVAKPEVAKGKVTKIELESAILKEKRPVGVYTPAGYDPAKQYPLVIAFDGEAYGMAPQPQIALPTIVDNLIAANKIPPVVVALVYSLETRSKDLPGSEPFSRFVAEELVPKLRADYKAGLTPADTVVTGSSFGGLCSTFTAFHHPDVIGNVLSQSGSYQFQPGALDDDVSEFVEGGPIIREIAAAPKAPLKFYMDAGKFEENLLASNRHLRDVLIAKGYPVTYQEFSGGHDYWLWRGTISDGLVALLNR
jgi:enterochelin esterase-like enzyme